MQIARRAGDDHLGGSQPAQHGRDGGCILVPLAGIADENDVGLQFLAALFQEGGQGGRAALLFALDHHRDGDRQFASHRLPGARRLQEGHQLTLVVLRPARHNHLAVAFVVGDAWLEGRGGPQIERIGRLHIVVSIEQNVRYALRHGFTVMSDDHRVSFGGPHGCLKADLAQL